MKGQIILTGYDENAKDKLFIVEAGKIQNGAKGVTNIVRFPQLGVSIQHRLLVDAIEFLITH